MPRIAYDSIKEHRNARMRALLDATTEILTTEGFDAVSFARVSSHVGIARNSIYDYFDSSASLALAAVLECAKSSHEPLRIALCETVAPDQAVETYVRFIVQWHRQRNFELTEALRRAKIDSDLLSAIRTEYRVPLVEQLSRFEITVSENAMEFVDVSISGSCFALRQRWSDGLVDDCVKYAVAGFMAFSKEQR